jgi:hypothetical protein
MPSTAIRRYAYRPDAGALDIEFITGRVYRYVAVPPTVAEGFSRVRSKGGYFNRTIRDRFDFVPLSSWDDPDNIAAD